MKLRSQWVLTCSLLCVAACTSVPKNVVCRSPAPAGYKASGQVSGSDWVELLLSRETPEKECTGKWVELPQLPDRCPVPKKSPRSIPEPSPSEKVVVREHGDGFFLVWVPTQQLDNGDGGGPVALVHLSKKDFSVVAIGTLRLPLGNVNLEMVNLKGEEILLAQGSSCSEAQDARACEHVLQPLVLDRGTFRPLELRGSGNRCLGEAQVDLQRVDTAKLDSGWLRKFVLTASYELAPAALVVQEQLIITDFPAGGDEGQARVFRRSQRQRKLDFIGAYFIASEPSLWTRTRPTRGDLR